MAKHEINIYENKTLSKTVAPYLGTYVTKRDVDMKELCERASQLSGLPAIQLEGMILGALNAAAEMQKESIVKVNFDGFCVIAQITGKFATADAEFGAGNKLLLALRLDSDIRNCLVNVTPTIVTEETTTKLRVLDVQDVAEPRPYGLVHGKRPFLIFGVNMVLTDEGATVFLEDSRGITYDVVVDEIVKEKQIIRAHTAALLEPGDYKVVVKTKAGEPDGQLQSDFRKVKYMKVVDPPTVDDIASEGHEGEIVSGTAFAAKGSGLDAFDAGAGDTVKVKWTQGGEDKEATIAPADIAADKLSFEFPDALVGVPMDTVLTFEITFGEVHKSKDSKLVEE